MAINVYVPYYYIVYDVIDDFEFLGFKFLLK